MQNSMEITLKSKNRVTHIIHSILKKLIIKNKLIDNSCLLSNMLL